MTANLTRHDFILVRHRQHAWERAMAERLDPWLSMTAESRVFEVLCGADPTEGRYWRWLSDWRRRQWESSGLGAGMPAAVHRELADALHRYHDALPYLSSQSRDIGRYKNVGELLWAADRADPAIERRDRRRAREQTVLLYDNEGWRLLRLEGPDASKRWAWGTRWCTGTASNYHRYRLRGELLVLITPTGKFQLAACTGELKDAADRDVALTVVMVDAPAQFASALYAAATSLAPV